MMQRTRILLAISAVFILAACSDPSGPCDARGACIVDGVDLVVEPPTVVEWPGMRTDSTTGLPVIIGNDSVTLQYHVRNRGDAPSDSVALMACATFETATGCVYSEVTVSLPSIAPGKMHEGTVRIDVPEALHDGIRETISIRTYLPVQEALLDYLNNLGSTNVLFANGRVEGKVEAPFVARVGAVVTMPIEIRNASPYAAIAADTLYICSYFCAPGSPKSHAQASPAIPAGGVYLDTLTFVLSDAALGDSVDLQEYFYFSACIGDRPPQELRPFAGCTSLNRLTKLLPDLDYSCGGQPILIGTTVPGETQSGVCSTSIGGNVQVWSFDAKTGSTYTATLIEKEYINGELMAVDHDGGLVWRDAPSVTLNVTFDKRYHIIVANAGSYQLSLTRE